MADNVSYFQCQHGTDYTIHTTHKMDVSIDEIGTILTAGKGAHGQLTPIARAFMVGAVFGGKSSAEVARGFNVSRSTVMKTVNRFAKTHSFEDEPRLGRPSIISERDKRYLEQQIKRTPGITYSRLAQGIESQPSHATLRRLIGAVKNADNPYVGKKRPETANAAKVTKTTKTTKAAKTAKTTKAGDKTPSRRKSTANAVSTASATTTPATSEIVDESTTDSTTDSVEAAVQSLAEIMGDSSTPIIIDDVFDPNSKFSEIDPLLYERLLIKTVDYLLA